jgi:hypothetical protein
VKLLEGASRGELRAIAHNHGVHVSPLQARATSLTAGHGIDLRNHVMAVLLHGAAALRVTAAIPP